MANGDASVERVLGSISLIVDTIPQHETPKLDFGDSSTGSYGGAGSGVGAGDRFVQAIVELVRAFFALFTGSSSSSSSTTSTPGGPVKPGTEEAFFLLATYCFDLERKMEYLYRATKTFALQGDPALARELLRDEETINPPGLTWKRRAMLAEARMRELFQQVGPEHDRLLRQVIAGSPPPTK